MTAVGDLGEDELIEVLVERRLRGVHTSLPGRVESYDHVSRTATVTPAVRIETASGVWKQAPALAEVPVAWPGGAFAVVHCPLEPTDTVLLVFCEQDFSGWLQTASIDVPRTLRRHGLHAIAIPFITRETRPIDTAASGVTIASPDGVRIGSATSASPAALGDVNDQNWLRLLAAFTTVAANPSPPIAAVGAALLAALAGSPTWPIPTQAALVKIE